MFLLGRYRNVEFTFAGSHYWWMYNHLVCLGPRNMGFPCCLCLFKDTGWKTRKKQSIPSRSFKSFRNLHPVQSVQIWCPPAAASFRTVRLNLPKHRPDMVETKGQRCWKRSLFPRWRFCNSAQNMAVSACPSCLKITSTNMSHVKKTILTTTLADVV